MEVSNLGCLVIILGLVAIVITCMVVVPSAEWWPP